MKVMFDADKAREERVAAEGLKLNGQHYPPAVRTNAVLSNVRQLMREQQRLGKEGFDLREPLRRGDDLGFKLAAAMDDMDAALEGTPERETATTLVDQLVEELRKHMESFDRPTIDAKVEEINAKSNQVVCDLLAALLDAPDGGVPITGVELATQMDFNDVEALADQLIARGGEDTDPPAEGDEPDPSGGSSPS